MEKHTGLALKEKGERRCETPRSLGKVLATRITCRSKQPSTASGECHVTGAAYPHQHVCPSVRKYSPDPSRVAPQETEWWLLVERTDLKEEVKGEGRDHAASRFKY